MLGAPLTGVSAQSIHQQTLGSSSVQAQRSKDVQCGLAQPVYRPPLLLRIAVVQMYGSNQAPVASRDAAPCLETAPQSLRLCPFLI